jgi:hypothetical protein
MSGVLGHAGLTEPSGLGDEPDVAGPDTGVAQAPRRMVVTAGSRRPTDHRLASLHLRVGMLTLARVELESMAGEGILDDDAMLDLAEVRWRTGDLTGAGEAASAHLAGGHETTLGLVIAAEAQAALGRPGEARRLAARALDRADGSLDGLFAGLPRAAIWPTEAGLDANPTSAVETDATGAATGAMSPTTGTTGTTDDAGPPAGRTQAAVAQPPAESIADPTRERAIGLPDGATELEAARSALAADDLEAAAFRFALVLRVAPALAPAVLDVVGSTAGPSFDLVRGDAYRLVGREIEARRSYLSAIGTLDQAVDVATEVEPVGVGVESDDDPGARIAEDHP